MMFLEAFMKKRLKIILTFGTNSQFSTQKSCFGDKDFEGQNVASLNFRELAVFSVRVGCDHYLFELVKQINSI